MEAAEKTDITLKELLHMSLGSAQISMEQLSLFHCLINLVLQKLNCHDEVVKISGLQGQCLFEILKTAKDPPPFKLILPTKQNYADKFAKIEELERRKNELSSNLESHFNEGREFKQKLDELFQASLYEPYCGPVEDLCSCMGRKTGQLCKSFAINSTFMLYLRKATTIPVVERWKMLEDNIESMTRRLEDIRLKFYETREQRQFLLPIAMKIETLKREADTNQTTFQEAVMEIIKMMSAKVYRVDMPALKNYLKSRFEIVHETLDKMKKQNIGCPGSEPSNISNMSCLSCGPYRKRDKFKLEDEDNMCKRKNSLCSRQSEINLTDRFNTMNSEEYTPPEQNKKRVTSILYDKM